MSDKDREPARLMAGRRHFVLAFKEDTIECIAKRYSLVGTFAKLDEAMEAAFREVARPKL